MGLWGVGKWGSDKVFSSLFNNSYPKSIFSPIQNIRRGTVGYLFPTPPPPNIPLRGGGRIDLPSSVSTSIGLSPSSPHTAIHSDIVAEINQTLHKWKSSFYAWKRLSSCLNHLIIHANQLIRRVLQLLTCLNQLSTRLNQLSLCLNRLLTRVHQLSTSVNTL